MMISSRFTYLRNIRRSGSEKKSCRTTLAVMQQNSSERNIAAFIGDPLLDQSGRDGIEGSFCAIRRVTRSGLRAQRYYIERGERD